MQRTFLKDVCTIQVTFQILFISSEPSSAFIHTLSIRILLQSSCSVCLFYLYPPHKVYTILLRTTSVAFICLCQQQLYLSTRGHLEVFTSTSPTMWKTRFWPRPASALYSFRLYYIPFSGLQLLLLGTLLLTDLIYGFLSLTAFQFRRSVCDQVYGTASKGAAPGCTCMSQPTRDLTP